MLKPLLIAAPLFVGILSAGAQITITTADMPVPTKTIYMANDTLPTVSIGAAGISQTWNMAALAQHTVDTSFVIPYPSAPNSVFSSANLVVIQGPQNFYGYAVNSAASMSLLGGHAVINIQGTPTAINQINTPAEILSNFPASYDSSFTNNYITDAKFYYGHMVQIVTVDSIRQKQTIRKTVLADAWGTLTTPLAGGPYNVLRIKETKIFHDTTTAFFFGGWNPAPGGITADSVVTYSWWANGFGSALATATMDSTGAVKKVQWLKAAPAAPLLSAAASAVNVTCSGLCDGKASVTAHWGAPPYTYSWNSNPVQHTDSASALCVGTYTVTITDSLLAHATAVVTIHTPPHPVITASGTTLTQSPSAASYQWYLNGVSITGAVSLHYTVTQNGNYTVSSTNAHGCIDTSAVFNFHTIGINESIIDNSFTIYPNPAASQITIKFDASAPLVMTSSKEDVLISITNELGQSIKNLSLKQIAAGKNEMTIDVADLRSGIYFIELQNNNTVVKRKFIKQ